MAEQLRYDQQLQRLNMPNVDFVFEKEIARGTPKRYLTS